MVKIIPPASTLYWPSAITVWSAPVPTYSIQPNILQWGGLYASGTTWYRYQSGSSETYIGVATFRIMTPGNYELRFQFTGAEEITSVRIMVNNSINTVLIGQGSANIINVQVQLKNLRGNSIVEIQAASPTGYYAYIRNIELYGGRNATVFLQSLNTGSTYSLSTSSTQNVQPTLNEETEMPPPTRVVSNIPTKLKGKYVIY